jgi:hypothetical protein
MTERSYVWPVSGYLVESEIDNMNAQDAGDDKVVPDQQQLQALTRSQTKVLEAEKIKPVLNLCLRQENLILPEQYLNMI